MNELRDIIESNAWMMARLQEVQSCNLPDSWIGAGFIRNQVWDIKHNISPPRKLNDIDVIFFNREKTSKASEKEIEDSLNRLCSSENWSVKNQARMHEKQGHLPYKCSEEALSHWIETATCVACRLSPQTNQLEIIAPHGIEDLMKLRVRPNPGLRKDQYSLYNRRIKEKGWKEKWPNLDIQYV